MCNNFKPWRYSASENSPRNKTLSVSYSNHRADSAHISIMLLSSDRMEHGRRGNQVLSFDRRRELRELSNKLETLFGHLVRRGNPSNDSVKSSLAQLRSRSKKLCRAIIPPEIAERIAQWEPGCFVEIMTDEHWIPWELLCSDGINERFWGERFVLSRTTCNFGDESSKNASNARKIFNIVGGGLREDDSKKAVSLFPSSEVLEITHLRHYPVNRIIEALKEEPLDVLHITCHGRKDPLRLQTSLQDDAEMALSVEVVEEALEFSAGCFVFANACNSANSTTLFNEDSSFGHAFCKRGASVFLGTLGPIPTKYAITLSSDLYSSFLPEESSSIRTAETPFSLTGTIGYAFVSCKERASATQNMFWLLYCMHGDFFHVC